MKIYSHYIFTVLGNAIDNIKEGYIDKNQTVHIFLNHNIVNRCIDTSEEISDDYTITVDLCREGIIGIYAENDEEETERIELIDSDELFEYLELTDTKYIFKTICNFLYAGGGVMF